MIAEIKGNIKIEVRRAKRTKKWLLNNILPLSTHESKSIRNKEYHYRVKRKKTDVKNLNYNQNYKNEILNLIKKQQHTHTGSLSYNYNASMYGAFKDALFVFEFLRLRGLIYNYFFIVEFEPSHVHTHYILNTYLNKEAIKRKLHCVFNGKYEKGNPFVKNVESDLHENDAIKYFMKKLNVDNRTRQSHIDYWYIGL